MSVDLGISCRGEGGLRGLSSNPDSGRYSITEYPLVRDSSVRTKFDE